METIEKLRTLRAGLGGVVELLLGLLDDLDGDPNLEDSDDDAQVDDDRCDLAESGDDEDGGDTEPDGDESDFDVQDHPHDDEAAI